jgi:hypothetical protein
MINFNTNPTNSHTHSINLIKNFTKTYICINTFTHTYTNKEQQKNYIFYFSFSKWLSPHIPPNAFFYFFYLLPPRNPHEMLFFWGLFFLFCAYRPHGLSYLFIFSSYLAIIHWYLCPNCQVPNFHQVVKNTKGLNFLLKLSYLVHK